MHHTLKTLLSMHWREWLPPLIVLGVVLAIGRLAKHFVFRGLERHAATTKTQLDDILIRTLRGPFMIWVLILGIHLAIQFSRLPTSVLRISSRVLLVLWIVSLTIAATRFVGYWIRSYGTRWQGALPVTSLTENVARLVIVLVGILILLRAIGLEVTPILATLGVGGLAVALALQNTLSNLFAGVFVSLAGQIRVGDYIRLNTGEEGFVEDITWRSTAIRALPNNLIIVPNSKLAEAIVTNYHLPEKRMSLLIPVSVSYDSDPDHVERILLEEARSAAREVPGMLADPEPVVRFIPGFGESSLNFTLICQVAQFTDQYPVQHELRKRILKRFRREGIEIPYPMRTVYLRTQSATASRSAGQTTPQIQE